MVLCDMIQRQVQLTAEQFGQVTQLETSIQYWSNEYTLQQLRAKVMLANIEGLYQARRQIMTKIYKEAGIDPTLVKEERFVGDGIMECACAEAAPAVPVVPSDGDPTSPAHSHSSPTS
jgi:hypothetical protein